jgi:hypothetical protein
VVGNRAGPSRPPRTRAQPRETLGAESGSRWWVLAFDPVSLEQVKQQLRARLDAVGPAPRAELLHVRVAQTVPATVRMRRIEMVQGPIVRVSADRFFFVVLAGVGVLRPRFRVGDSYSHALSPLRGGRVRNRNLLLVGRGWVRSGPRVGADRPRGRQRADVPRTPCCALAGSPLH